MRRLIPLTLAAGALTACSDFDTPAQLPHPQILAVVAEPPIVAAGERAALSVLVAGPDGPMAPALTWSAPVVVDGDGQAWFEAPVDAAPGFATVEVTATLADGTALSAEKAVGVGRVPADNPVIAQIRVDGAPVQDAAVLHRDWVAELSADVSPAPTADAMFAWYATVGELSFYRRTPAELETPSEALTGHLFVVYRDGFGGVAWRHVPLEID